MAEPGVLQAALRAARKRRAGPKATKALLLAGFVESGMQHKKYRNVGSGDRDSVGFLQQRPSQGWGPAGESVETDANQFLNHAMKLRGKYGSAAQLAQAVQRSAFPDRYANFNAQADKILGRQGNLNASRASSHDVSLGRLSGTSEDAPDQSSVFDVIRRMNAAASQDSDDLIEQNQALLMEAIRRRNQPEAPRYSGPRGDVMQAASRQVDLQPGGGYEGSKGVAQGLASIGIDLGLKSTSEKRDNKNPYSGRGSDHDIRNKDAYAFDLSNGSRPTPEMDEAAYGIMRQLGFKSYKKGQPINASQGVKTIKTKQGTFRVQVIYRGDGKAFGGNHRDHIHVGVKRLR